MMIINSYDSRKNHIRTLLIISVVINFLLVVFLMVDRRIDFSSICIANSACGQMFIIMGSNVNLAILFSSILTIMAVITSIMALILALRIKSMRPLQWLVSLTAMGSLGAILLYPTLNPSLIYNFAVISLLLLTLWLITSINQLNTFGTRNQNRLFLVWLLLSLVVITVGVGVSASDAGRFCNGFPLCGNFLPSNGLGWLALGHRILTAILLGVSLQILRRTWMYYRTSSLMLISVTISFTLLLGQVLLGALQVIRAFPVDIVILHAVCATGYLVALLFAFMASRYEKTSEAVQRSTIFNDRHRLKDFYLLNKPIIVILLLVTTYAGMVVSLGKFPSFQLTFWTILAGALAAGGSSAINQYIDREIDLSMQRTATRPVPSGRLMPAEALALGIAEIVVSFFLYVSFVNVFAALLAMAGMFYYVFIYSLWLKHATVQNIVIGGGAGAIPPLVGWAAATGSLNVPSLFLFALVFLWTPPHFWALALVRKNDYARAKVPMMPVIKGERSTRIQIFIYTVQLVILTLIMPLFKLGGNIYLVSAIFLGLWLLHAAWRVLTKEGNKVAYKMYRYSSMYLAFIFLALAIDALV